MARIRGSNQFSVLQIKEFHGVNENPDGDTNMALGELAVMRNFAITRDHHLQLRPGQKTVLDIRKDWDKWAATHPEHVAEPRFCGAWTGLARGQEVVIASFGGALFYLDLDSGHAEPIGSCTQDDAHFFGFENDVYMVNGHDYLRWDGGRFNEFQRVEGYVPTVKTACTPQGQGQSLEAINRLTGVRRVKFSPDGKERSFCLPEKDVDEVVSVTGTSSPYSLEKAGGKVHFEEIPAKGTNTLTIVYRKGTGNRSQVEGMRFSELYNGNTDARVFLYGDGSNRTIYSGTDLETGRPRADYFPELYEAAVGEANGPITGMVRHFSRLLIFKPESTWSMDYTPMAVPGGSLTSAFRVAPVNRNLGNDAPGQVRLVENDPVTLDGGAVYQWQASTGSAGDNRMAGRLDLRVRRTLSGFDFKKTVTFNRREAGELWLLYGGLAAVLQYQIGAWAIYDNCNFVSMLETEGETYGITREGRVQHFSRRWRNDDGAAIHAYAETGAMDFGRDWNRKYSPELFIALQPESGGRIEVSAQTNRRGDYPAVAVAAGFTTFGHANFGHWSFATNRKPQVRRVPLKVRRAVFYKLVFRSDSASAAATVLGADVRVRGAGGVR